MLHASNKDWQHRQGKENRLLKSKKVAYALEMSSSTAETCNGGKKYGRERSLSMERKTELL